MMVKEKKITKPNWNDSLTYTNIPLFYFQIWTFEIKLENPILPKLIVLLPKLKFQNHNKFL